MTFDDILFSALVVVALILGYMHLFGKKAVVGGSRQGPMFGRAKSSAIPDSLHSWEELHSALRRAGLESSSLIVGIDFTRSNEWSGKISFNNRNMHTVLPHVRLNGSASPQHSSSSAATTSFEPGNDSDYTPSKNSQNAADGPSDLNIRQLNPYQAAIYVMGKTLEEFDDDRIIPAFGFGDKNTTDKSVFEMNARAGQPNHGFVDVLRAYENAARASTGCLSGPTSFAPLIRKAIEIVRHSKSYHILVIVADGQVDNKQKTIDAIVEAAKYPLSIIMVGVGDGPWDAMREFDDELPERQFDNFQFVCLTDILASRAAEPHMAFAVAAMQEIPEQYKSIKKLGLL